MEITVGLFTLPGKFEFIESNVQFFFTFISFEVKSLTLYFVLK